YYATKTDCDNMNQDYNHGKAAVFSWYKSKSLRYNMLVNVIFNNQNSTENGSVVDRNVYVQDVVQDTSSMSNMGYPVRLHGRQADRPHHKWKDNSICLRQPSYLGRLDTLSVGTPEMEVRPTNTVAHNSYIRQRRFTFFKNEEDLEGAFPYG